eukprot:COSAG01_NODE_150_length_23941_cov_44.277200_3_plen_50_part_00
MSDLVDPNVSVTDAAPPSRRLILLGMQWHHALYGSLAGLRQAVRTVLEM